MINYIIQVVLFQTLFLVVYDLFLQKETFFKWNRFYLLATPFLSFIIPLLKFESIQKAVPQEYVIQLPTVFLNPQEIIEQSSQNSATLNYLPLIFYSGMGLFLLLFLIRLTKIIVLITSNKIIKKQQYSLVILEKRQSAFSFFNYIFIHKEKLESSNLQIVQHELIHCKQKHTLDLLFFEILKIVLWFNPLIYVYQKRITLLHEYISDAEVVNITDKKTYFNKLLAETFNVENISFINQFFKHSLIKKRILMITKEKSQKIQQLKYLIILPLLVTMLVYVSCTSDAQSEIDEINNIISKEIVYKDGKYFETKNGIIIFTGSQLVGEIVPYEKMSNKEKEIFNNFKNSEIEYSLVIDGNGDRVHFIKIPQPTTPTPPTPPVNKQKDNESIPFSIIDEVPVFPGCTGTKSQLRTCLQEKITKHVSENFNSNLATELKLEPGIKRIFVMFTIDKEGNITDIKSRAPHKKLQEEAIRVINLLPQMVPGKQRGKAVGVKYSLPIAFKVD